MGDRPVAQGGEIKHADDYEGINAERDGLCVIAFYLKRDGTTEGVFSNYVEQMEQLEFIVEAVADDVVELLPEGYKFVRTQVTLPS